MICMSFSGLISLRTMTWRIEHDKWAVKRFSFGRESTLKSTAKCSSIFNHLSIIVQVNGRCVLSQCLSMPVSLTAPDGAVESLLDAVLPDTLYVLMDVFDVFLLASSLCTAVLSHDFRPAASKGESLVLRFYTSLSIWFAWLVSLKPSLFISILIYSL